MHIAIGCDHRGFDAKNHLISVLRRAGHDVKDYGCQSLAATDYPEVSFGVYEGRLHTELSSGEMAIAGERDASFWDFRPPSGESR